MESGLKSLTISSATSSPSPLTMACRPFPQPPQRPSWPAPARSPQKPSRSAPIVVAASPSKKRAAGQDEVAGWTATEYSIYSVSPPPSSVPMPTSLLKKAPPTACSVHLAAVSVVVGVDVGATDELRRLLRL